MVHPGDDKRPTYYWHFRLRRKAGHARSCLGINSQGLAHHIKEFGINTVFDEEWVFLGSNNKNLS